MRPGGYLTILGTVTEAHFVPDHDDGAGARDLVVLTGADLTIADVEAVARGGARVALDTHARDRMQEARDVIDALVAAGEVVYGVTTGFGDLATTFIPPEDAGRLQREPDRSATPPASGAPFPREVVRAMLLLRANTLALGHCGCRPLLVDRMLRAAGAWHPPGRAGAGERRRVRRPRAAGPSRAAADRARRGGASRDG